MPEKENAAPKLDYQQAEDFTHSYANNVQLLSSNWDLELIFGQLDQKQGPNTVVQHDSITLSWAQAKLLLYFLQSHVKSHELEFGRIVIPAGIIPPVPEKQPPQFNLIKPEHWKKLREHYLEFISANPEAATVS
jgi:hypothetical protein